MNPDFENLRISEREIEILSGLDVSEIFVGGVFGGVYRSSIFRHPQKLFIFCVIELLVTALTFTLTLPIGLFALRNSSGTVNDIPTMMKFLQITLSSTIIFIISWNLFMIIKAKTLKTFMCLLDEIDNFHHVVETVVVLDRLKTVGNSSVNIVKENNMMEVLELIRQNLTTGLMAEKIMRQNRRLLARRNDLLANIENNLGTLQTLAIEQQATDYGQVLKEALEISLSIHQEIQKL
ncbi:hypothetical protein [Geminocystis sp. NIES-3709]|uniref:hypothetical protein n=1 Tax=Geminocystis sp. NIES-3709 TaxID=1617448 RepID=UPI0005FC8257|nr:hypothetical protein [Geminocystis sp. NIES-3709]BAQ66056.1 hypothetical protein GM3709_2821 [Geminocystis sp. NIES-3709]